MFGDSNFIKEITFEPKNRNAYVYKIKNSPCTGKQNKDDSDGIVEMAWAADGD